MFATIAAAEAPVALGRPVGPFSDRCSATRDAFHLTRLLIPVGILSSQTILRNDSLA
jgi:hypothetical protein